MTDGGPSPPVIKQNKQTNKKESWHVIIMR